MRQSAYNGMMSSSRDPLEAVLRHCAASAPEPWYPSAFARATGTTREKLDPALDRLRMAGMIRLTDWVQGAGQGYVLTPEGEHALEHPGELHELRDSRLEEQAALAPSLWPAAPQESRPRNRADRVRLALLNPPRPWVSLALIAINVLVFLAGLLVASRQGISAGDYFGLRSEGMVAGDPRVMQVQHQFGAIRGIDLLRGEWWRLIACCFVHFGLIHLAVNMWSLYAVGPFLEICWGRARFLLLYLVTGLAGSCAMVSFTPQVEGAGASGAIWGVFASLLPWILLNRRYLSRDRATSLLRNLLVVIVLNVFISMLPGISAAAHFGGGAAGVLAGAALNEQRFGRGALRWLAGLFVLLMPVICVGVVVLQTHGRTWEQLDFKHRQEVAESEELEAEKMKQEQLLPLIRRRLKTPSTDRLRQIVSVSQAIRAQLGKAEEALRAPYRDPKVEGERDAIVKEIERKRRLYEHIELGDFLLPAAADALAKAVKAMSPLDGPELRLLGPRVFPPGTVENLTRARQGILDVAQLLREAGVYQDSRAEELRQTSLQALDAWSALLKFSAGFLEHGEDWNQNSLHEFTRLRADAIKRWSDALKSGPLN
jgi:rhomboid protease GluP